MSSQEEKVMEENVELIESAEDSDSDSEFYNTNHHSQRKSLKNLLPR